MSASSFFFFFFRLFMCLQSFYLTLTRDSHHYNSTLFIYVECIERYKNTFPFKTALHIHAWSTTKLENYLLCVVPHASAIGSKKKTEEYQTRKYVEKARTKWTCIQHTYTTQPIPIIDFNTHIYLTNNSVEFLSRCEHWMSFKSTIINSMRLYYR